MFRLSSILISAFTILSASIINIPSDYSTIQEGINASIDGDTVLVAQGTYVENLIFRKRNSSLMLYTTNLVLIGPIIII